jgi:hypothetical protein
MTGIIERIIKGVRKILRGNGRRKTCIFSACCRFYNNPCDKAFDEGLCVGDCPHFQRYRKGRG